MCKFSGSIGSDSSNDQKSMCCEKVALVIEGAVTTTDSRIVFSTPPTVAGNVAELGQGTALNITLPDDQHTTLVQIFGAVDPKYGNYEAAVTMMMEGMVNRFGAISASANRPARNNDSLLYYISPIPNFPGHGLSLSATGGPIGLTEIEFCMLRYVPAPCGSRRWLTRSKVGNCSPRTGAAADASSKKASNIGPIVGGVVGGIVALALIGGLFFFCRRRKKSYVATLSQKVLTLGVRSPATAPSQPLEAARPSSQARARWGR